MDGENRSTKIDASIALPMGFSRIDARRKKRSRPLKAAGIG